MARCKCTLAQSLTGDGCELCQPEVFIDYYKQTIADLEQENEQLQTSQEQLLEALESMFSLVDEATQGDFPILRTAEVMANAELAITNAKQVMGE